MPRLQVSPDRKDTRTSHIRWQLAPELKFAGYDGLIVKGKADGPVYIFIDDSKVEIRDASHLWGQKPRRKTETLLKEEMKDPNLRVMSIGPAAEKSCSLHRCPPRVLSHGSKRRRRLFMGSKKLKAVAVRGTRGIEVAKPQEFSAARRCSGRQTGSYAQSQISVIGSPDGERRSISAPYPMRRTWM